MRSLPTPSFPWSRLAGALMLALAVAVAMDPDYPVPSRRKSTSPALGPVGALRSLAPLGMVPRRELEFRWQWDGGPTEFEVTLHNEELAVLASVVCGPEPQLPIGPDSPFAIHLLDGRGCLWTVRATGAQPARSSPTFFRVVP